MPPSHPAPPTPLPRWKSSLPNALTIARLAMTAALVALLASWSHTPPPSAITLAAAALFILAAATDALDGYLARRWNAISTFGRVMDPLADKVLVLSTFILLAGPAFADPIHPHRQLTGFLPWMCVVLLARELLVTSLRAVLESQGQDFSASTTGKLKMILQSVAAPTILLLVGLGESTPGSWGAMMITVLAWATTLATAVSGVPYVLRAIRPPSTT